MGETELSLDLISIKVMFFYYDIWTAGTATYSTTSPNLEFDMTCFLPQLLQFGEEGFKKIESLDQVSRCLIF
jgi:hypothetical protein